MNRRLNRRTSAVVAALALVAAPVAGVHASSDAERDLGIPEPVEVCLACHAIAADEPELEGPTLWGVMGRRIGEAAGFEYSDALRNQPGYWDRESLDRFLASPQQFAPGVNMTFGGVRNAADRTAVIDFLETLK
jgi:cytochrome c